MFGFLGLDVFKKKSISELKQKSTEQLIRENFDNYFKKKKLPKHVVDEIIERIKLNLTADDLWFGVNEILDDNKIKIVDLKSFQDFILNCKVFYQVRKQLVLSSSSKALNQLEYAKRADLIDFHVRVHDKICYNQQRIGKKIYVSSQDNLLSELKIPGAIFEKEERVLSGYGMANCGPMSKLAIKKSLQIQSNKKLNTVVLSKADHAFNKSYDETTDTNKADIDVRGTFLDIWQGKIAPQQQTSKLLCGHRVDNDTCLNYTFPLKLKKIKLQVMVTTDDVNRFDKNAVCDKAIQSLEKLQATAEEVVAEINRHKNKENSDKNIFALLTDKQEDLMSFSADIQFAIEQVGSGDFSTANVTLIDEFNAQIENFYTVLFCKILPAPKIHPKLFDKMHEHAKNHLKILLSQTIEVEDSSLPEKAIVQDVVIDIPKNDEDENNNVELIFQMNL